MEESRCRQWRGQGTFDAPAKARLPPATVRTLQIGNPEEIICEEQAQWYSSEGNTERESEKPTGQQKITQIVPISLQYLQCTAQECGFYKTYAEAAFCVPFSDVVHRESSILRTV